MTARVCEVRVKKVDVAAKDNRPAYTFYNTSWLFDGGVLRGTTRMPQTFDEAKEWVAARVQEGLIGATGSQWDLVANICGKEITIHAERHRLVELIRGLTC